MPMKQGQHIAIIGQTGSGKSTLARELLRRRGYCIICVTKPDPLLWPATWKRVTTVKKIDLAEATHFILRPSYYQQRVEIWNALDTAWKQGGWTIYLDEEYYIEQQLGLDEKVIQLLTQGRSNNITMIVGMQRPAWVSRFNLSEPTHIICGRLGDERDMSIVKSVIGSQYLEAIKELPRYKFVWLNKNDGTMKQVDKYSIEKAVAGAE